MAVPKRPDWKTFRASFGIPEGAVSGVNFGQALDDFHKVNDKTKDWPTLKKAADSLIKTANKYVSKLDKTKITAKGKDYGKFKSAFTSDYITPATVTAKDAAERSGDVEAFAARLRTFIAKGKAMKHGCTASDIAKFDNTDTRGIMAVSAKVKAVDVSGFRDIWDDLESQMDAMGSVAQQGVIDSFVDYIHNAAGLTEKWMAKVGL